VVFFLFRNLKYSIFITVNNYIKLIPQRLLAKSTMAIKDLSNIGFIDFSTATATADQKAMYNYYAFGSPKPGTDEWYESGDIMPNSVDSFKYRYGFNGKEKEDDIKGEGNSLDFGARVYDSRLGRWLSLDPLQAKYPGMSPYNFVGNMPICAIDPDGRTIIIVTKQGTYTYNLDGTLTNSEGKVVSTHNDLFANQIKNFINQVNSTKNGSKVVTQLVNSKKVYAIIDRKPDVDPSITGSESVSKSGLVTHKTKEGADMLAANIVNPNGGSNPEENSYIATEMLSNDLFNMYQIDLNESKLASFGIEIQGNLFASSVLSELKFDVNSEFINRRSNSLFVGPITKNEKGNLQLGELNNTAKTMYNNILSSTNYNKKELNNLITEMANNTAYDSLYKNKGGLGAKKKDHSISTLEFPLKK
jgi:RHS repeat-associated protein